MINRFVMRSRRDEPTCRTKPVSVQVLSQQFAFARKFEDGGTRNYRVAGKFGTFDIAKALRALAKGQDTVKLPRLDEVAVRDKVGQDFLPILDPRGMSGEFLV
jgi:hypothetical protein